MFYLITTFRIVLFCQSLVFRLRMCKYFYLFRRKRHLDLLDRLGTFIDFSRKLYSNEQKGSPVLNQGPGLLPLFPAPLKKLLTTITCNKLTATIILNCNKLHICTLSRNPSLNFLSADSLNL